MMRVFRNIGYWNRSWLIPLLRVLVSPFFKSRYLRGRHFDTHLYGWIWVFKGLWFQKCLGFNRNIPWPCSPHATISNPANIDFHPDDLNNFQSKGTYFQNLHAQIRLGYGVYIAPNVGIITANHRLDDLTQHAEGLDVEIGPSSWLGMNSVVLPGVVLGPKTIVGAGAVVTKSFPDGHVVIGGNPARVIRELPKDTTAEFESNTESD